VVDFEAGPAIVAGLVGGGVMVAMLYAGRAMMPAQMRMDLLLLLGGMMGLRGPAAYASGLMMHGVASVAFGLVHAAVIAGADIDDAVLVWGIVFGAVHALGTGMALGMMPAIHPEIRAGRIAAPGPFALSLGVPTAVGFLVLHLAFGAIVAVVYAAGT
jgi:hypothetical protein